MLFEEPSETIDGRHCQKKRRRLQHEMMIIWLMIEMLKCADSFLRHDDDEFTMKYWHLPFARSLLQKDRSLKKLTEKNIFIFTGTKLILSFLGPWIPGSLTNWLRVKKKKRYLNDYDRLFLPHCRSKNDFAIKYRKLCKKPFFPPSSDSTLWSATFWSYRVELILTLCFPFQSSIKTHNFCRIIIKKRKSVSAILFFTICQVIKVSLNNFQKIFQVIFAYFNVATYFFLFIFFLLMHNNIKEKYNILQCFVVERIKQICSFFSRL